MKNCYRLRATFDDHFLARAYASHKSEANSLARFLLRNVDHTFGHTRIVHRYRLPNDDELPPRAHGRGGAARACYLFLAMNGVVDAHAGKAAGCVESFISDGDN